MTFKFGYFMAPLLGSPNLPGVHRSSVVITGCAGDGLIASGCRMSSIV